MRAALIAVVCALIAAVASAQPAVYWSRTQLVVLPSSSGSAPNPLLAHPPSAVAAAGAVYTSVNGTAAQPPKLASPDVTLSDLGVLDGSWVRLEDVGGQWNRSFARPVLDIQVVGQSEEAVKRERDRLIGEAEAALRSLQDDAGAPIASRLVLGQLDPLERVERLARQPLRTFIALAALGAAFAIGIAGGRVPRHRDAPPERTLLPISSFLRRRSAD